MKRIYKYICLLIIMNLCFISKTFASNTFETKLNSDKTIIRKNDIFNINVTIDSEKEMAGFISKFTYDKTKLELIECKGENGYNALLHTNLVIDKTKGNTGVFSVSTIKFKVKETLKKGENTEIKMTKVKGAFGTIGTDSNIVISHYIENDDLKLNSLTVENKNVLNSLKYTTKTNKVNIQANAHNCFIDGIGEKELVDGENIFDITLTTTNGLKKVYKLKIYKIKNIVDDKDDTNDNNEDKNNENNDINNNESNKDNMQNINTNKDKDNFSNQKDENNNTKNDVINNNNSDDKDNVVNNDDKNNVDNKENNNINNNGHNTDMNTSNKKNKSFKAYIIIIIILLSLVVFSLIKLKKIKNK